MMKDLDSLRKEIDHLDEQLWEIINQRVDLAREIGEWKRTHGLAITQPQRYQQVIDQCLAIAQKYGLSQEVVREVMDALHKESVRVQS